MTVGGCIWPDGSGNESSIHWFFKSFHMAKMIMKRMKIFDPPHHPILKLMTNKKTDTHQKIKGKQSCFLYG